MRCSTVDDMPRAHAPSILIPMLVPQPSIRSTRTQLALARDEVCYVGQTVAVVIADSRYLAEYAAAAVEIDYEPLPAVSDARDALKQARRACTADLRVQRRVLRAHELRRRRRGLQDRAACVRRRHVPASRRTDDARGRAVLASYDAGGRHAQCLVGDADAASLPRHPGRPVRAQPRIDPRDRTAGWRRLRHQGAVLSGGGRDPGRGDEARPPGEMAGGPPRAFPVVDAGARPILEGRHRGRRQGRILGLRATMLHDTGAYLPWGIIVPFIASTTFPGPMSSRPTRSRPPSR